MRAGFGDQDPRTAVQPADGLGPFRESPDISFCRSQQDGEGGEGPVLRNAPVDEAEHLGVGDDQCGPLPEAGRCTGQGLRGAAKRIAAAVEQFPQDLDLRQDDPAFRRFTVLGHHQQHRIAFLYQIAGQVGILFGGTCGGDARKQRFDGLAARVADDGDAGLCRQCPDIGDIGSGFPAFLRRMSLILGHRAHDDGDVGLVEDGKGAPPAFRSEDGGIVEACGVDQDGGPDAQRQFDGLADRVGRRSGYRADQRDLLARDGVDQRRFAAVYRAEKGDVEAFHAYRLLRSGSPGFRFQWLSTFRRSGRGRGLRGCR